MPDFSTTAPRTLDTMSTTQQPPVRTETVHRIHSRDMEPVHGWFGLTYSSYLVLPRTLLQSMPHEWQARLVALLEEAEAAARGTEAGGAMGSYWVRRAGERGKFLPDPLNDYQRGRRRIALNAYREQAAEEKAPPARASDDPAREVAARVIAWMEGHVEAITYIDDAGETHEWEPPLSREDATLVGQLAAFVVPAAAPAAPEVPRAE